MLLCTERPVTPEDLDVKTCAEIAALLKQYPSKAGEAGSRQDHWQWVAQRSMLFFGRDSKTRKLVAMGCMNLCPNLTASVARIEEIVIDKDARNESTECDIFFGLIWWAEAATHADSLELDDEACMVSELVLEKALFFHRLRSHHWRRIIPRQ